MNRRTAHADVLQSRDRVVGLRGGAGTRKSFLLKEIFRGLEERYDLLVFAPTSSAVDVLHKDGLRDAITVQRFLIDLEMRKSVRGWFAGWRVLNSHRVASRFAAWVTLISPVPRICALSPGPLAAPALSAAWTSPADKARLLIVAGSL